MWLRRQEEGGLRIFFKTSFYYSDQGANQGAAGSQLNLPYCNPTLLSPGKLTPGKAYEAAEVHQHRSSGQCKAVKQLISAIFVYF
jgi:hypothetical protein